MGVCYGHQLLNRALVGEHAVRQSPNGFEAGWRSVSFTNESIQVPGVSVKEIVWQHHFDEVVELPAGSVIFASNQHSRIQAFINPDQLLLGTQFHPEFDRDQGNEFFQKDRKRLEKFHFNVDEIIRQGPSIETGKIFFNYFLNHFNITQ